MDNAPTRHATSLSRAGARVVLALFVAACASDSELRPFSSDGCSLFPDASLVSEADWCACCFEHDVAYWRGGTREQREVADRALRECVHRKTGNEALAAMMYEGVLVGGSPYFYNWYRWGYGWSFDRKYQPLSPAESAQADRLLDAYFAAAEGSACAASHAPARGEPRVTDPRPAVGRGR